MGFAPVAATAILMLTGLFSAGVYWEDVHASQKMLQDGERQAARLRDERAHTDMGLVGTSYVAGPNTFTVTLQNDGDTVLRASELTWVVNGVWSNDLIDTLTVDGIATRDVWAPGSELVMQMQPMPSTPTRLVVTAGNGAQYVGVV